MLDDTYFMKQALIEAGKAAERGEVPVGAVRNELLHVLIISQKR